MTRSLRRLGVGLLVLMAALLVQLTRIQVFQAPELNAMPGNQRTQLTEYSRERGPILVDQAPIARSVATPDEALKHLRTYSAGRTYASVTGFYSIVFGTTGLERAENEILSGEDPRMWVDRMQQLFAGRQVRGGSVTTTLDPDAQAAAYKGISGKTGSVVAIEPSTGRILAQVQSPSFDPNKLSSHSSKQINEYYTALEDDPDKPLLNRPIAKTNPPGSTFKVVTAAAALESGRFTPDSVIPGPQFYTLPGTNVKLPNWTGKECGPDGKVTLREALAISCNTAFAWLGNQLGADALRDQAEKFGFGTKPLSDIGSVASRFPDEIDTPQTGLASIGGFNVAATPLQMAMVAAAVRNDGVVMQPYLVESVRSADLQVLSQTRPSQLRIATSASNAAKLRQMMVDVVTGGTGWRAKISGVTVGGKTGTANSDNIRTPYAWFIAWADDPDVAVCVFVQDAEMEATDVAGGRVAAPIAKAVIEALR